jgi:hypothetical protein
VFKIWNLLNLEFACEPNERVLLCDFDEFIIDCMRKCLFKLLVKGFQHGFFFVICPFFLFGPLEPFLFDFSFLVFVLFDLFRSEACVGGCSELLFPHIKGNSNRIIQSRQIFCQLRNLSSELFINGTFFERFFSAHFDIIIEPDLKKILVFLIRDLMDQIL